MVNKQNLRETVSPISYVISADAVNEKPSATDAVDRIASSGSSEYEPYDYGNEQKPLRSYAALVHMLKYIVGTGILAIPYTFKYVGYAVGIAGVILLAFVYLHSLHTLLAVEYELCKRLRTPSLTYLGVIENAFKGASRQTLLLEPVCAVMVFFNFVINSLLYNAGYLIVMSGNVKNLYDGYYDTDINPKLVITAIILPLTLLCWIPKLRFLTPLSMVTCIFTCINIVIIITEPAQPGLAVGSPKPVNDVFFFPQFFGIVLSAASMSGLIFPVKNDMGKPKRYGSVVGVLNASVLLTNALYATFGCLCYLKYGDATQGNVLLNLQKGKVPSMVVYVLYTLVVCVSFVLNFYVVFDTTYRNGRLGEMTPRSNPCKFCVKYGYKTLVNVATYALAMAIPNFELFASLTGTVGTLIELCIPSILQIVVMSSSLERKKKILMLVKNFAIMAFAVVLFATGLYGSVLDIIKFYG